MTTKEKIQSIWKEERQKFSFLSKDNFRGMIKTHNNTVKVIGILIDKDVPVGINHSFKITKDQDANTIIKNIINGDIPTEIHDKGIKNLSLFLKGGISQLFMEDLYQKFEQNLEKKIIGGNGFKKILETIQSKEDEFIFKNIFSPFKNHIDIEALEITGSAFSPTEKSYIYYANTDSEKRKLRHQAAHSIPALANFIADKMSLRLTVDKMEPLQPALDNVVGKNNQDNSIISKSMMKRLNGRKLDFKEFESQALNILAVLSELPPDWFPKDDQEWDSFLTIHTTIGQAIQGEDRSYEKLYKASSGKWTEFKNNLALAWRDLRPPEGATKADMDYIEKAINLKVLGNLSKKHEFEKIRSSAKAIAESIPLPKNLSVTSLEKWINNIYAPENNKKTFEAMANAVNDISDGLSKRIVLPCVAYEANMKEVSIDRKIEKNSQDIAKSMIFDGRSLSDGLETLRKIRSQYNGLTQSEIGSHTKEDIIIQDKESINISESVEKIMKEYMGWPGDNMEWTPFVDAFVAPNGVACIPLTNSELLSYEGEFMNHCVGDYHVTHCKNDLERIFSLRMKNNADEIVTLATMAVNFNGNEYSKKPYVSCVLGYSNSYAVSPACNAAVDIMKNKLAEIEHMGINAIHALLGKDKNSILEQKHLHVEDNKNRIEKDSGYDWKNKKNIFEAMSPWGPFISKPWRKKPDMILESDPIQNLAKEINPSLKSKRLNRSSMSPAP